MTHRSIRRAPTVSQRPPRKAVPGRIALLIRGNCGYTKAMVMRMKLQEQLDALTDQLPSMCHLGHGGERHRSPCDAYRERTLEPKPNTSRAVEARETHKALTTLVTPEHP